MSNSNIKGGGRVPWTDEVQHALTDLLLSIREPSTSIGNKEVSSHEEQRIRKTFVKGLVARHERRALAAKVNPNDTLLMSSGTSSNVASQHQAQTMIQGQPSNSAVAAGNNGGNQKVRIELIEAFFPSSSKKKAKSGSSNKKSGNSNADFKEGSRKVMVLSRQTKVDQLLLDAKAKLRMKKKPTQCFVVEKKKLMMALTGNLTGIEDGSKVYVTHREEEHPSSKDDTKSESKVSPSQSSDNNNNDDDEDVLESVKRAYQERKVFTRQKKHRSAARGEHPRFQDHFDQLPKLSQERAKLPAAGSRHEFLAALDQHRVVIVCGATGSGKSTQIPPYILEGMASAGQEANILVTQPRRVAATSLARRVAHELQSAPPGSEGSQVGYSIRLDRAVSDTAQIVYCTVGILLRRLVTPSNHGGGDDHSQGNEFIAKCIPLDDITHVVIDEVHERDINTDFVLTLLRRVLLVNKHLRVVLMSATASTNLFVDYFDKIDLKPAIIEIPGRTFPVDIEWISGCEKFATSRVQASPELAESSNPTLSPRATSKIDNGFLCKLIRAIILKQQEAGDLNVKKEDSNMTRTSGAILVFLPGKAEIEALARNLYSDSLVGDRNICSIWKLHSSASKEDQHSIFRPAKTGSVKIVIATNIAETSITIPDVSHVIDTGRVKESRFNSSSRIKELVTVWTSQASAKQRAGRAGRTSAGTCWRLYSEEFYNKQLPLQTCPEILRSPVDELVMQICLLFEHRDDPTTNNEKKARGVCPIHFLNKTVEPPEEKNVMQACKHLLEVGALRIIAFEPRVLYRLTPLGYHLSRLPMDPKVGKVLLVGCILGCLHNSLIVAAALSATKSCFLPRFSRSAADWQACIEARKDLTETGFGGPRWTGAGSGKNVVKGDLTVRIAAYRIWEAKHREKDRATFCSKHAIDNAAMKDMSNLCSQFLDCLVDGGFVDRSNLKSYNKFKDDALLTSCCLVAGLYPNVCTLMRPRKGGLRGGRLITKEQDICKTSSGSFQTERLKKSSESGRDVYAVYHSKHRSVGTSDKPGEVFLSEIDFVSRFALLLFGGDLAIVKNAIIVDGWLKFKVGDSKQSDLSALVLIQELRTELDKVLLSHMGSRHEDDRTRKDTNKQELLIDFVRKLLIEQ